MDYGELSVASVTTYTTLRCFNSPSLSLSLSTRAVPAAIAMHEQAAPAKSLEILDSSPKMRSTEGPIGETLECECRRELRITGTGGRWRESESSSWNLGLERRKFNVCAGMQLGKWGQTGFCTSSPSGSRCVYYSVSFHHFLVLWQLASF